MDFRDQMEEIAEAIMSVTGPVSVILLGCIFFVLVIFGVVAALAKILS